MPEPDRRSSSINNLGGIGAVALDSSGDPLAITTGRMKIGDGDKLGLQLYALKAARNLAKKLKHEGKHDGPVIYESGHVLVTCCLHERATGNPEEMLRAFMPEDLMMLAARAKL